MPIVNYFLSKSEAKKEKKFPLSFCYCKKCGLAQLNYLIDPKKLFTNYHYSSGASVPLSRHLTKLAKYCLKNFPVASDEKVLDIGANDGIFLSQFVKNKVKSVAVEPAQNMKAVLKRKGVEVITEYFSEKVAGNTLKKMGQFKLIIATHVLANIVDLKDFLNGVTLLLEKDGIFVVEVGSLQDTILKGEFDAIYHEHYSYFSFSTLEKILHESGFEVFKANKNNLHGGSIRLFARKGKERYTYKERITAESYKKVRNKAEQFRRDILNFLSKNKGKFIVGYGAPAKAVTLLNYCGITNKQISCIVDSTVAKQGKLVPGVHIPIYKESYLRNKHVDIFVILAWNYEKFILQKIHRRIKYPVQILIPFPKMKVISAA
jgi:SAM-dependent methyltransferase